MQWLVIHKTPPIHILIKKRNKYSACSRLHAGFEKIMVKEVLVFISIAYFREKGQEKLKFSQRFFRTSLTNIKHTYSKWTKKRFYLSCWKIESLHCGLYTKYRTEIYICIRKMTKEQRWSKKSF
ncbi:MAG: hypothetical protein HFI32_01055 [Lachnospiraceae bacterium]|jgi:hypothetical protein|nr:hypothetical protein [Lachnospiraceae bacterium]